MSKQVRKLCACLLNVSEAHDIALVEKIAIEACKTQHFTNSTSSENLDQRQLNHPVDVSALNIFNDSVYNRSVITIVADSNKIGTAVTNACKQAYQKIDLSQHKGGHPRLGSVDLIPIHPISSSVTLEECGNIATDIAITLSEEVPGTSFFLFGSADKSGKRGLVERRKQVGWFSGKHDTVYGYLKHDVGATPSSRYGLTGVGAIPYVMNCNVTIDTKDVTIGKEIAAAIRATTQDGLPGVQSMAFPHTNGVEIACNVEALYLEDIDTLPVYTRQCLVQSFGNCYHISGTAIENRIRELAAAKDIQTVGTATIVGFAPEEANALAHKALSSGIAEFWRFRKSGMM